MSDSKAHLFDRVQAALDSIVDEYNHWNESDVALAKEFRDYRGLMQKELEESEAKRRAVSGALVALLAILDQTPVNKLPEQVKVRGAWMSTPLLIELAQIDLDQYGLTVMVFE